MLLGLVILVRGRFIAETPEQIEILRHKIFASQDVLGIEGNPKDLFAEPTNTHFRTINAKLRRPRDFVCRDNVSAQFGCSHPALTAPRCVTSTLQMLELNPNAVAWQGCPWSRHLRMPSP